MMRTVKGINNFIVYCYTNIITGQKYIGQTCQTLEERAGNNGANYVNGHGYFSLPHFGESILYYGWRNFTSEILKENLTQKEADYWERYYIREWKTLYPNGLNGNKGGQKGRQVNQYSFDGELIATYPTATKASEILKNEWVGYNATFIRTLCNKSKVPWNKLYNVDYYYVFDDEDKGFLHYIPSRFFENKLEETREIMEYKYQLYSQSRYYDFPIWVFNKKFELNRLSLFSA